MRSVKMKQFLLDMILPILLLFKLIKIIVICSDPFSIIIGLAKQVEYDSRVIETLKNLLRIACDLGEYVL